MNDVDRLRKVAAQFVARVRDDSPEANARWLANITDAQDRYALLFVLAAWVPDDATVAELEAWLNEPPGGYDTEENTARRRRVLNAAMKPRRAA